MISLLQKTGNKTIPYLIAVFLFASITSLAFENEKAAPPININGKVVNKDGRSIEGASVQVKGTLQRTTSKADGTFELRDINQEAAVLVISSVGYQMQELAIARRTDFTIVLSEIVSGLEDVVVVGYGSRKKSDLTGSVATVSAENLKERAVVNFGLKLRISYGIAGNNRIGNYSSIGLLASGYYPTGDGLQNTVNPSTVPNDNLGWEKVQQSNVGFDLGLFNNRIRLEGDFYSSKSIDLLLNVPVPTITSYSTQIQNIGKVLNKGMEYLLTTKNVTGAVLNERYVRKYYDVSTSGSDNGNNWIELRLADIYLLYAEALVRTGGDKIKAIMFINRIRERARNTVGNPAIPKSADLLKDYTASDFPNDNALLLAIEKERRVELAFENHRWFDLVRTNRAKEVMIAEQLADGFAPFTWSDDMLSYPIPLTVMQSNPGKITQNKGYTQL